MSKEPNVATATRTDQLTSDVLDGLRRTPKEISPVWFYDEFGSLLFDSICELPEYYLTRTELAIMEEHASDMSQLIGPQAALIEYGSGTSFKTRMLLDHLVAPWAYVPVDIARDHLFEAASTLARDYPALRIVPVCADFTQPFELPRHLSRAQRRVVYFPGSTIGNFEPHEASSFLKSAHKILGKGALMIIGADLEKDERVLHDAYNDAAGVTARFNLNVLVRINRELGGNFDLSAFTHRAIYNRERHRIEMHLISKKQQAVRMLGTNFSFRPGESIHTENSYKYSIDRFTALARGSGWKVKESWTDSKAMFSVHALVAE